MKYLNLILFSLILASCSGGPSSSDVDKLAVGEINELICEEECVIEEVHLKDVELESINLKNITFKNSFLENVTIKGSEDKYTILENVKFIDSEITNFSLGHYVITYNPSSIELTYLEDAIKTACEYFASKAWEGEYWEDKLEECRLEAIEDLTSYWRLDYTDFKNWRDGFRSYSGIILDQLKGIGFSTEKAKNLFKDGMSIQFENVTGSIRIRDVENSFISSKVSNSSLSKFEVDIWKESLVFLHSNNSNFKNLSYWHPGATVEIGNGRGISETKSVMASLNYELDKYPTVSLVDSKVERLDMLALGEGGLNCENSEFGDGNLFLVVDYCLDMGIAFDEFSYRDFDKSFIPENSVYGLKSFIGSDYSNYYYGERLEGFLKEASSSGINKGNQLYAIASGDTNFLMSYFDGLYKHMFLEDQYLHQPTFCQNDHSLLLFDWNNVLYDDNPCNTRRNRLSTIKEWSNLPDSFKTKIDDRTIEFVDVVTASHKEVSKKDKELFLTNFVIKNHSFSNLKNCLRSRDINFVRDTLRLLYEVPPRSSPYFNKYTRHEKATRARMQERASTLVEIQDFKECIENNISVYSSNSAIYNSIEKLNIFAGLEVRNFRDEKERQRVLAERKRREEREKLFATFVENGMTMDYCGIMATSMGSQVINMYYSGSSAQKDARTKLAFNSCNRCIFNFWSNILNDDDFTKMSNGDTENMSTDMSSFGYADVKRLMMCAVSGADPRVRREYELMMQ